MSWFYCHFWMHVCVCFFFVHNDTQTTTSSVENVKATTRASGHIASTASTRALRGHGCCSWCLVLRGLDCWYTSAQIQSSRRRRRFSCTLCRHCRSCWGRRHRGKLLSSSSFVRVCALCGSELCFAALCSAVLFVIFLTTPGIFLFFHHSWLFLFSLSRSSSPQVCLDVGLQPQHSQVFLPWKRLHNLAALDSADHTLYLLYAVVSSVDIALAAQQAKEKRLVNNAISFAIVHGAKRPLYPFARSTWCGGERCLFCVFGFWFLVLVFGFWGLVFRFWFLAFGF